MLKVLHIVSCVVAGASASWNGTTVAALMNQEYHSYDPDNESSPVGVYVRQTEEFKVYCHLPCFQGMPDCRISGMLYNSKVMYTPPQEGGAIAWTFHKQTAWYVNSTLVHTKLGKCSYPNDGGTMHKYNMGCGCENPSGRDICGDNRSAFANRDADTNYTTKVQGNSTNVAGCACGDDPSKLGNCFYKGAAYFPEDGPSHDDTREMLKYRLAQQSPGNAANWNEMILDGSVLLDLLERDAASVIPAILYNTDVNPRARDLAQKVAQDMADHYKLKKPVPVIRVNTTANVTAGENPFVFEHDATSPLAPSFII